MGSGVKAKDEVFLRSDNYVDRLNVRVTVNLRSTCQMKIPTESIQ